MNCFRFYFERIKCKEYLFNLSSCITHLWEKQKWCSLWSDKVCKLVFDAKLNSLGRLMSRVWKARLIVVKHRRFINCQTTHSKCSRLPRPDPAQKFMRCSVCHRKAGSLSMLECLPECECTSGCVRECVCGSFIKFARTSSGRWAMGGWRWAWRRLKTKPANVSSVQFPTQSSFTT